MVFAAGKKQLKKRISENSKSNDPRDYNTHTVPRLTEAGRPLIKKSITYNQITEATDCGRRWIEQKDSRDYPVGNPYKASRDL